MKSMKPLDVYFQYPIALLEGKGCHVYDDKKNTYLDMYSGHGVISIGHGHPHFTKKITEQLNKLAFYTNAFINPLQDELAQLLGEISGYNNYNLFLSNSGAEANENALKIASFCTGRKKILAVKNAFHGRSAGAVAVTDDPKIQAPFGEDLPVDFVALEDFTGLYNFLSSKQYAAFIIEGVQGVGGVHEASTSFWLAVRLLCSQNGTVLIADEVQSGYGRSGKFFAHQHHGVIADIITTAKGMGNGFPIGGTIINPILKLEKGKLGTTFGGGQLACAAAIAVLEIMKEEKVMENVQQRGEEILHALKQLPGIKALRGHGLLIGIEFDGQAKDIRNALLNEGHVITGFSSPDVVRILPPLNITSQEVKQFVEILKNILKK
jgi:acetylornithine/N-succinyldiaminopimelate aminotransferase